MRRAREPATSCGSKQLETPKTEIRIAEGGADLTHSPRAVNLATYHFHSFPIFPISFSLSLSDLEHSVAYCL